MDKQAITQDLEGSCWKHCLDQPSALRTTARNAQRIRRCFVDVWQPRTNELSLSPDWTSEECTTHEISSCTHLSGMKQLLGKKASCDLKAQRHKPNKANLVPSEKQWENMTGSPRFPLGFQWGHQPTNSWRVLNLFGATYARITASPFETSRSLSADLCSWKWKIPGVRWWKGPKLKDQIPSNTKRKLNGSPCEKWWKVMSKSGFQDFFQVLKHL